MLEDGKTLNTREYSFFQTQEPREKFEDPRSPAVGCDFYHKYPEDLKLMGQLGPKVFRYSIAWARIIPSKDAEPNQKAIDFYNKVIDGMLEQGITPFMDLFHSDLPLWLEEEGGIADDRFVQWYADYAEVCFKAFGDRVKWWSTVNEPKLSVYGAYAFAHMHPFKKDPVLAWKAVHNMNLAHFEAVRRLREIWPDAKIGSVHNTGECYCRSFEEEDIAAARRHWAMQLVFSDPMILGKYPEEMMAFEGMRKYVTDEMLKKLGRPHTYGQAVTAFHRIRKAGFRNVSVDLMYGLPGQTLNGWIETLQHVLTLRPEHISCYGLKVEPGTPLYQVKDISNLPNDDLQADMYLAAVEVLANKGYRQYEISNFARRGLASKHNMKYWLGGEYLGFGPDASSDFAGKRFKIVRSLPDYINGIKKGGQVIEDVQEVPARERAGEYIMLRLRTVAGISPQEYEKQYLLPFAPLADILEKYKERRYVSVSESGRYHLTAEGFLISNTIISDLLLAQENSEPLARRR